jgi:PmbA protein
MDYLAKLKPQVEQVEVVEIQSESTTVGFENNRLKSSQTEETKGTAIRVIKEGQLGFSASSDDRAQEKLLQNVLESASFGDKVPLSFPEKQPFQQVKNFDRSIVDLSIPKMVAMGEEVIDTLLETEPDLKVNVRIVRRDQQFTLRNHTGFDETYQRAPLAIECEIVHVKEDDVLIIWEAVGATSWQEDYLAPVRKMSNLLVQADRSGTIKSGQMPVIFSPKGALALTLPILQGLNGKLVYTGVSPMKDRVGEKMFDEKLTVVDDPTLPGRYSSAPFDDEGVATKRNVLIDQGVLKNYYWDLKTAAQSGVESTGNGARSLFNPPAPTTTNFIIEPGDTTLKDMIAGIDEGLWVEDVMGLGQSNIVSGAFSNTLSLAYKIEKGEITGRVKDVSIAGNIYSLLPNIAAISQETDWIYLNFCLPHILIDQMNVVTKE